MNLHYVCILYCEQYNGGENLHDSLPVFTKDCILEQIKNRTFYLLPSNWFSGPPICFLFQKFNNNQQ